MWRAIEYTLVFLALQLGVTMGVSTCWHWASSSEDITANMLITSMTLFSVATIAVFMLAKWFAPDRTFIKSRPYISLIWCVLAAVGAVIPSLWLQEQIPPLPNIVENEFGMIMKNPAGYIAVGLIGPLAEEIVFRGTVLRSLLEKMSNHWVAILISAVLFALVHGNPAQMPHALLIGLLLGWMFQRTGSIAPGVVFHWVNNTIAFAACYVMPDPDIPLIVLFNGSETRVATAVVSSLLIFLPSLYQLNRRL